MGSRFFSVGLIILSTGCTLFATRPVQEMSDTAAALRAAREVQADSTAPELYRQADEYFFRAKKEYKFKNFSLARDYANRARSFAEQAEFEAIRSGANRAEKAPPDPFSNTPPAPEGPPVAPPKKYDYPTPTGTPASEYEERQRLENAPPQATPNPTPTMNKP